MTERIIDFESTTGITIVVDDRLRPDEWYLSSSDRWTVGTHTPEYAARAWARRRIARTHAAPDAHVHVVPRVNAC